MKLHPSNTKTAVSFLNAVAWPRCKGHVCQGTLCSPPGDHAQALVLQPAAGHVSLGRPHMTALPHPRRSRTAPQRAARLKQCGGRSQERPVGRRKTQRARRGQRLKRGTATTAIVGQLPSTMSEHCPGCMQTYTKRCRASMPESRRARAMERRCAPLTCSRMATRGAARSPARCWNARVPRAELKLSVCIVIDGGLSSGALKNCGDCDSAERTRIVTILLYGCAAGQLSHATLGRPAVRSSCRTARRLRSNGGEASARSRPCRQVVARVEGSSCCSGRAAAWHLAPAHGGVPMCSRQNRVLLCSNTVKCAAMSGGKAVCGMGTTPGGGPKEAGRPKWGTGPQNRPLTSKARKQLTGQLE